MEIKTSEKIVHIAFKHFLEKGYEATNIRDICNEVGIKSSSMYFYYKSKQQLFFYIYDDIIFQYLNFVRDIEQSLVDISIEEKLYILLRSKMEYHAADISKKKFILRYHLFPPEEISNIIREKYKFFINEENKIILNGIERCRSFNEFDPDKLEYYLLVYKRLEDYLSYEMAVANIKTDDKTINKLWNTFSNNKSL